MPTDRTVLETIDGCLDDARLWGLELNPRYRVLAATVEPRPERHPRPEADDPRLQALLYPVAVIAACLRRHTRTGEVHVETFEIDQLVDVVDSFGGSRLEAPILTASERRLVSSVPGTAELSLEGRSQAGDGDTHLLRVHLEADGGRRFDLEATFDEVLLNDAAGQEIPLAAFDR